MTVARWLSFSGDLLMTIVILIYLWWESTASKGKTVTRVWTKERIMFLSVGPLLLLSALVFNILMLSLKDGASVVRFTALHMLTLFGILAIALYALLGSQVQWPQYVAVVLSAILFALSLFSDTAIFFSANCTASGA
jgi:hypothetical protein